MVRLACLFVGGKVAGTTTPLRLSLLTLIGIGVCVFFFVFFYGVISAVVPLALYVNHSTHDVDVYQTDG
jgi:hypothetical protein